MLNIYFAKSFLYNCADKISGEFFILFYDVESCQDKAF